MYVLKVLQVRTQQTEEPKRQLGFGFGFGSRLQTEVRGTTSMGHGGAEDLQNHDFDPSKFMCGAAKNVLNMWEIGLEKIQAQKQLKGEALHELMKQLDEKQAWEMEQLTVTLSGAVAPLKMEEAEATIEKLRADVEQLEAQRQEMEAKIQEWREKEGEMLYLIKETTRELEDLGELNDKLVSAAHKRNDEVQDCRKEVISSLEAADCHGSIGIKKMGELEKKPFLKAMKRKYWYDEKKGEDIATALHALWEEYLEDPNWHPFKCVEVKGERKGQFQEVIDEEDERIKSLKTEVGDKALKAVMKSLQEIKEYNPNGRFPVSELWNYREGRRATLKEGVGMLLDIWKTYKRPKKSTPQRKG